MKLLISSHGKKKVNRIETLEARNKYAESTVMDQEKYLWIDDLTVCNM